MLTHLVCFKDKAGIDEAAKRDHRERLGQLKAVAGVLDLAVGADVERSPRSYDTGLVVRLIDRAALHAYLKDPLHRPVGDLGRGLSDHIVVVDFED